MAPYSLNESILEFLNSAKSSQRTGGTRCACGWTLTSQNTTFFYNGQSWKVVLPLYLKCHAAPHVPISLTTHSALMGGAGCEGDYASFQFVGNSCRVRSTCVGCPRPMNGR